MKKKIELAELTWRPAKPEDAKRAGRLLFETFPKMATFLFGLGNAERGQRVLTHMFGQVGHRFSFESAEMVTFHGKVVGMLIAVPGRNLWKLNWRLAKKILKQYRLRGKLALMIRSLPLAFIKEADREDLLLSNLAVVKKYRGQGIGSWMLTQVTERAKMEGFPRISLGVSLDNPDGQRFYERHGFKTRALQLESNVRVKSLGPGTRWMVKELL